MVMPATYGRPGIYVTEQLSGPNAPSSNASPSGAALVGEHWRGPVGQAVLCSSWTQFVSVFGGFNPNPEPVLTNPYLAYAVYKFFSNGGSSVWVTRVASSATPGTAASVMLADASGTTPQETLELVAGAAGTSNVGTWGNNLAVTVTPSTSGFFNLSIYYGGVAASNLVESWTGLTMQASSSRYAPAVLNSSSGGSAWVTAVDQFSSAVYPENTPLGVTGVAFSGGTDCASPATSDRVAAVTVGSSSLDSLPGALTFNLPGEVSPTVVTAAVTYASTRPSSFVVLDPPAAQTVPGVVTYMEAITPVVSNAALYYPWPTATNPASSSINATISLPPGGFVLGQMVSTDASQGVWTAPAGISTVLAGVVQAAVFSPSQLSTLNLANVNALRTRPNNQVVIWGARTLESGYASLYVPVRRTLNYIESTLSALIDFAVFAPNNEITWGVVSSACSQFLSSLLGSGAFPSSTAASAYYVTCDSSNNTPTTISQGVLVVEVGVALQVPSEFISLTISQFQSTGVTTVSTAS